MTAFQDPDSPTAQLIEVFSAIQGEGLNVGTRQLFIRFGRCDLRCHFCDSAHTWDTTDTCQIERSPGLRDFETHANPVSLDQLLDWVDRQNEPGLHDSISLTGGEPLLHTPFLMVFLPQVRDRTGLPIYLETGGHRPVQVQRLLPYLDMVGMDWKLPSVSGETWWEDHQQFLRICHEANLEVFVKLIISDQTDPAELARTAHAIAQIHPEIPAFLQPVTPLTVPLRSEHRPMMAPAPDQVLTWQQLMKRELKQVRVIPQTHKMIGQL